MDENTKSIKLNENFHTALAVIKKDTGAAIRFSVHIAIRAHIERYYPHLIPVLKGEEPKK